LSLGYLFVIYRALKWR